MFECRDVRLSHLSAVAVLAALAVALFAALQFAVADNHKVVIEFDDSDAIVADGDDVVVTVKASVDTDNANSAPDSPDLMWVRVSGGLSVEREGAQITNVAYTRVDNSDEVAPFAWSSANKEHTVINPKGTAHGEYTVSAMVDPDGSGALKARTVTKILTVDDPGDGLGSATLTVTDADGNPNASKNSASASDDGTIYLTVQALNSLGEKSNNADVSQIIIYARGGDITIPAALDGPDDNDRAANTSNPNALTASPANAKESFTITAGGDVAASVDVYVTLIGGSGVVTSNTVEISFTGPADAISVGDPSGPLGQSGSEITVEVTAMDSAGTGVPIGPDAVSAVVKGRSGNDPDVGTEHQKGDNDRDGCRDGTVDPDDANSLLIVDNGCTAPNNGDDARTEKDENGANDNVAVDEVYSEKPFDAKTVVIPVTTGAEKADPGEYTLVVSFGEDETEITFNVAGPAANVEASTDADGAISIGQVVEVTATVTDADGIPVMNSVSDDATTSDVDESAGEPVTFTAVGALKMRTIANQISTTVNTKGGVAKTRFVVTEGSGTATIIVSAGDASTFVSLSSEAEEAMPEEEASVACLSNLAGFATWACGVESSASEIFGLVSGRGATALHLWNGSAWVRYSVVDGTMVPGSSDFMVAENDILYISN